MTIPFGYGDIVAFEERNGHKYDKVLAQDIYKGILVHFGFFSGHYCCDRPNICRAVQELLRQQPDTAIESSIRAAG
jgi:hypothetical protein